MTSAKVSPRGPSIRLVLVSTAGRWRLACASTCKGLFIARARIAHRMGEAAHGFDVLRELPADPGTSTTVSTSRSTPWKSGVSASTAVCGLASSRVMARYAGGIVAGAAIRQIVAVHRGEHDVLELRMSSTVRAARSPAPRRPASRADCLRIHRAEAAGTRARRAHEHDGRRAESVPAFTDVRAFGLFAHGRRGGARATMSLTAAEARTAGCLRAQPRRPGAAGRGAYPRARAPGALTPSRMAVNPWGSGYFPRYGPGRILDDRNALQVRHQLGVLQRRQALSRSGCRYRGPCPGMALSLQTAGRDRALEQRQQWKWPAVQPRTAPD